MLMLEDWLVEELEEAIAGETGKIEQLGSVSCPPVSTTLCQLAFLPDPHFTPGEQPPIHLRGLKPKSGAPANQNLLHYSPPRFTAVEQAAAATTLPVKIANGQQEAGRLSRLLPIAVQLRAKNPSTDWCTLTPEAETESVVAYRICR